jgi:hypothetical protein
MPECSRTRPATRRDGAALVECHLYDTEAAAVANPEFSR